VIGILDGKDAVGIMSALVPAVARVFATAPDSDRATDPDTIADVAEAADLPVTVHPTLEDAADAARAWAAESDRRAVVIAGSVVLAGEALRLSELEDWKSGWQA
ncbi:dihydrofolate synthase, partial [Microbacterium testaceum]